MLCRLKKQCQYVWLVERSSAVADLLLAMADACDTQRKKPNAALNLITPRDGPKLPYHTSSAVTL